MGLSRDVAPVQLSITVWPLEGLKVDQLFWEFFADISVTVWVRKIFRK